MALAENTITAVGKQTGKGVEATEFKVLCATSNSLEKDVKYVESNALTGKRFVEETYPATFAAGGSIDSEIDDITFGIILENALGVYSKTGIDPDITHTFKAGNQLQSWLTFLKDFSDESCHEKFLDCRVNQLSLALTSQAIMTYTADILGITSNEVDGIETVIENTGTKLFAWQSTVSIDGTDVTALVDDFSFQHNNGIKEDDYGLFQSRRSLDAEKGSHTFELTMQFDKTKYLDYRAKLKNGVEIPLTIDIGGKLIISYPKAKLEKVSAPISSGGKITVKISGNALWDKTDNTNVTIDLINSVTSY